MLPGRFTAAVFDVDGLLVATEAVWAAAEAELLARHGLTFSEADRVESRGRSVDESVATYAERIGLPGLRLADLRTELLGGFRRRVSLVRALPGARILVSGLARSMRLGVASSSPRPIVDEVLEVAGLAGEFEVIVSGDDVACHKPEPDAYLLACRRLGVRPHDAIAFEDSRPGIQSAVTAGMYCVAVQPDPAIDISKAHLVLPSLEAVEIRPAPTAGS